MSNFLQDYCFRYVMPDTVFDRPEIDPENQCYCNMDSGDCSPQGVFNATPCAYGKELKISTITQLIL